MPYILSNKHLEVHVDLPLENYNHSRFDWTGKITQVKFHNIPMSSIERTDTVNENHIGKGLYNEFGMDTALGFEEAKVGDWFHKIGVGLLKKDSDQYDFLHNYKIKPAQFEIFKKSKRIIINCNSADHNGYSYILTKKIELEKDGFSIQSQLQNNGSKEIITDEYNHNFLGINREFIGSQYILKFPFQLNPKSFDQIVNPDQKVNILSHVVNFNGTPVQPFFFSNLSGSKNVKASWELFNTNTKIGIRETGSFQTKKVNLWGWKHVISPELFCPIHLSPGQSTQWSRNYDLFKL